MSCWFDICSLTDVGDPQAVNVPTCSFFGEHYKWIQEVRLLIIIPDSYTLSSLPISCSDLFPPKQYIFILYVSFIVWFKKTSSHLTCSGDDNILNFNFKLEKNLFYLSVFIFTHQYHQVLLIAWSSLTLSHNPSLSFIDHGRLSRLHPVIAQSWCI